MTVRNYLPCGSDPKVWYTPDEAYDRSHLAGKVVLLTGPTAGLGAACIDEMCGLPETQRPKKLVLVGRSPAKLEVTAAKLRDAAISSSSYVTDLLLPEQVLRACREICGAETELHIAVLNAGAWLVHKVREVQADGLEHHYALNFLQMAIFIKHLGPLLSRSATASTNSRICVMGSYTSMQIAKGVLDVEHAGTKDGPVTMSLPSDYVYSQSKLMQHVFCKGVKPPQHVTLNVACCGAAPSNTPGWNGLGKLVFHPILGYLLHPVVCWVTGCGLRLLSEGIGPIMHLMGSRAMEGVTGKHCDFGYKNRKHRLTRPVDLEVYPSEDNAIAQSIADADLVESFCRDTHALIAKLETKYPPAAV